MISILGRWLAYRFQERSAPPTNSLLLISDATTNPCWEDALTTASLSGVSMAFQMMLSSEAKDGVRLSEAPN